LENILTVKMLLQSSRKHSRYGKESKFTKIKKVCIFNFSKCSWKFNHAETTSCFWLNNCFK